ncbi:MAG: gamma-glutamyl-gamma-aminobutyrate hydrolase family protein [Gemmatimonadota bacterium]
MRSAPFIAVTVPVRENDVGISRAVLEAGYLQAVRLARGVPLVLSPVLDLEYNERLMDLAQGLVLTGGEDLDPASYGQSPDGARRVSAERDALEFRVLEMALASRIPVVCICRGIQLLNVALGGTLYQDLATHWGDSIAHDAFREFDQPIHAVRTNGAQRLREVFETADFSQNSSHHQGIRDLSPDLDPVAWAADGLIEGVEIKNGCSWVVGVQWHPERLLEDPSGTNRRLFQRFGAEVRRSTPTTD